MKKKILLLVALFTSSILLAQKIDKNLTKTLKNITSSFQGDVGIFVQDLNNGKTVMIGADQLFPTASMIKIPILVAITNRINSGELQYHQVMQYHDSLLYAGEDILGSFKSGEEITLSKLIMLMLTMSDNTASLWLQQIAGGGMAINLLMDSIGLKNTRVNSRTEGREKERAQWGWGQTTPKEMALLLKKIYKSEVISPAACDRMLRSLNRNYWDREAISQIPPYVTVFSKSGAVDESRSEVVLVKGKKAAYVFCICTNNNKDKSWKASNEAWTLIRNVSSLLWHYFEPKDQWQPPKESANFF